MTHADSSPAAAIPKPAMLLAAGPQTFDNGVICASEQSVVVVSGRFSWKSVQLGYPGAGC